MRWPWRCRLPQPCQLITVGEHDALVFDENVLDAFGDPSAPDYEWPIMVELRACFPTQTFFFMRDGVLVKQVIRQ